MVVVLIVLCVIANTLQNLIPKFYEAKNQKTNSFVFSAIVSLFACLVFIVKMIIDNKGFNYSWSAFVYSLIYAVCFSTYFIFQVLSFKNGALSITALFLQLSLLIPVVYGFFIGESLQTCGYIALVFLVFAMVLLNLKKDKKLFSLKWLIFVLITCISNGVCTIFSKAFQLKFEKQFINEYMIVALLIASLSLFLLSFILSKREKTSLVQDIQNTSWYSVVCGIFNGLTNLFILIIVGTISVAWFFPLLASCGIVVSFLVSYFVFKEKISYIQFIGYIFGLVAVVLFNI